MKFSKKILATVSIFSVLLPTLALAADFSDVPATNPNYTAIQALKDSGVISGYADGTFKPTQSVNRAEALAIILKAAQVSVDTTSTAELTFTDVPKDAWFYAAVQKGVALKKIKGYSDNTFRPGASVTLPEALAMATSFFNVDVSSMQADAVIFAGYDRTAWYAPFMQYAKNQNIIDLENGLVSPTSPLTRAQLAEVVYRMRTVVQMGKAFDMTTNWITETYAENFWKIKRPQNWNLALKGIKNSVFVRRTDPTPIFITRMYPNGATLSISVIDNTEELSSSQYFSLLKTQYNSAYEGQSIKFEDRLLSGRTALWITVDSSRVFDSAIYLPNKKVLMMYGEYGSGVQGEVNKKYIQSMVGSYEYVDAPPVLTLEQRVAQLRENILIKDAWKTISPLFPDKKLISTDAIGIGTGPVDYYFTAEANLTIKLERNSGTILNTREGSTTAF